MRFDLLALTGGQGVSMAVCPVQTCLALNLYLSGSCLPNDFTITLSRLQAVFERTEHQIFCLVIFRNIRGRQLRADSTCHLQYTEIMFGYKIQYLHNNIWPASAGTFIIFPPVLILTK